MSNKKNHTNLEIIEIMKAVDLIHKEGLITIIQQRAIYKKINKLK